MTVEKTCKSGFDGTDCSSSSLAKTIEQLQADLENAYGGQNTGDITDALIAMEEYRHRVLIDGIIAVHQLMEESKGVFVLHLNGEPSPWDELRTGGRFKEWLQKFDEAYEVAWPDHTRRNCT